MCVKLYYLYSPDDWAVGSTDRSIYVQEVFLQERLLGICYNSLENFNSILILKNEKHLNMWLSE